MIYDFPESSSPIAQGDIFFSIPILDLPDDELSIVDDAGNVRTLPWETFASEGEPVSSIIAVRPTIAIVGTQECDALRAPNITLFEVRPFRDVERKSKETTKPSKWVPIITQHARINQKWFYLPADERVGFSEKMGADFLTPIPVPRLTLERLLGFRKGRLNEVAKQHFRERLAEFFRRYAYDEWYPLTREELAEYQKNHPEAEPFPWQFALCGEVNPFSESTSGVNESTTPARQDDLGELGDKALEGSVAEKGYFDYWGGSETAMQKLTAIISEINKETDVLNERMHKINEEKNKVDEDPGPNAGETYNTIYKKVAGNLHVFARKLEEVNPNLENVVQSLTENVLGLLDWYSAHRGETKESIDVFRKNVDFLGAGANKAREVYCELRDTALSLKSQNLSLALNTAIPKYVSAINVLVANLEETVSFCLKVLFLIDEKFGEDLDSGENPE
jgi:hypothetical protein